MWFQPKPVIRFVSKFGAPHASPITQIKRARDVRPAWVDEQRNYANPRDKFLNCPGMVDYMHAGYLIPAWCDIKIKANAAGVATMTRENPLPEEYGPMNPALINDAVEFCPPVKPNVTKVNMPWAIFMKSGYSAQVVPAFYHSPFLRDLHIFPGIVDYDVFSTINFIFSAKRECEIEIFAGTPLLQVIPFKREDYEAQCRRATQSESDKAHHGFPTRARAAYRRFFHQKKSYKLEVIE